ncbi:MAG: hypothetical protein IT428_14355 [Planctomycetaceae bacterium]|nr:hypothetical protein [Planctomycetaceae bacterium]
MAIRVYCDCGRALSVPDDRAGRKTKCPVCGAVLPVPRQKKGPKSSDTVLTEEFITGGRDDDAPDVRPDPIDQQVTIGSHSASADGTTPKKKARRRRRDDGWTACFRVPLDHLRFLLGLSFCGALAAALFVNVLQSNLSEPFAVPFLRTTGAFIVTLLMSSGFACEFLSYVVADASLAGSEEGRWIRLEDVALSMGRYALCVATGPVFPLSFATWYWVRFGAGEVLDRIILFECFTLAAGWMAFQLLLTSRRPLAGMLPVPVVKTILALGWRSLAVFLAMGMLLSTLVLLWHPAMIATSRGFHWAAFRLWFVIHLLGITGAAIVLDVLGGWYARFVAPPPPEESNERRKKTFAEPLAIPEPIPESTAIR